MSIDTSIGQIHPLVKHIFYDLPLEKSRKEIREVILKDKRFVSTSTPFNNYDPDSFFKGITKDKGLIISNPDSIKIVLFFGNTTVSTKKGADNDLTNMMLVNCRYFYSTKDSVEIEYKRMLCMLQPIQKDTTSEKSEHPYLIAGQTGKMIVDETRFDCFNPFYRVGLSSITMIPDSDSKSTYVLDIVFGKEDK
jgi:hypothetical protein